MKGRRGKELKENPIVLEFPDEGDTQNMQDVQDAEHNDLEMYHGVCVCLSVWVDGWVDVATFSQWGIRPTWFSH